MKLDIRNCTRCGKIYQYDGFKICPSCRKEDEEDFIKVKDYLYQHPGANLQEVHEGTGVDVKKIIEFLREGRLEIADESNIILQCERCGRSIKTGRYCSKCAEELKKELSSAIKPVKSSMQRDRERFRVIDRLKKKNE